MNASVTIDQRSDQLVVRIPMQLKRRGGRKEIIVPGGLPGSPTSKSPTQEPLVTALARAFHWQDLIETGRYQSITELAEALGVDRSYVGRILRLALLAPDIVEMIVEGREPSGLSLEQLLKGMPLGWEEQRQRFGISFGRSIGTRTPPLYRPDKPLSLRQTTP
ncbi:MAG: hypothetical protein JXA57_02345 [Armatimonadetes bacterium]|nr:hypothetical protein [Armatimonadota bacterium]